MLTPQSPMPTKSRLRDRQQHQLEEDERDRKADEPPERRLALQDDRADLVGDRRKGQPRRDDRMRRSACGLVVWLLMIRQPSDVVSMNSACRSAAESHAICRA